MADDQRQIFETVAQAGRRAIRELWRRRGETAKLAAPEKRLLAILEQHPEFAEYWEGKEPSEEENPFLHVGFHDTLEKQIEQDDPPGTGAALERLVAKGVDRHEALHQILRLLVFELHAMVSEQKAFDQESYARKLDKLGT